MNYQEVFQKYKSLQAESEKQKEEDFLYKAKVYNGAKVMKKLYDEQGDAISVKIENGKKEWEVLQGKKEAEDEKFDLRSRLSQHLHRKKYKKKDARLKEAIGKKRREVQTNEANKKYITVIGEKYEHLPVRIPDRADWDEALSPAERALMCFADALNNYEKELKHPSGSIAQPDTVLDSIKRAMKASLEKEEEYTKEVIDAVIEEVNAVRERAAEYNRQQEAKQSGKAKILAEIEKL